MDHTSARVHARIVRHEHERPTGLVKLVDALLRRLIDIGAAALGLIVLAPSFAFIAILIKRDSEGPIFYRGWRIGKGGEPFKILKFRTMYERPESYLGPKITGDADPRITPIGQWLRDTKINELPQLWNVLKGEMSLVGPRPEDPDFVEEWPEATRQELLAVRPGITSPASVLYSDEESLLTSGDVVDDYLRDILPGKLRLDSIYVRHRTVLSDLDVLFLTAVTLLPLLRRKPIREHMLFWGPLARFVSRHFSWFVVDFAVALLSVTTAGIVWRSSAPLHLGLAPAIGSALLIAVVFSAVNALLGLHRIFWSKAPASATLALAFSTGLATLVVLAINLRWRPEPLFPPGMLVVAGILAYGDFVLVRYRERLFTGIATKWLKLRGRAHATGERVLIVGAGDVGTFAAWLLRRGDLAQAFSIVGMVDDAPHKQGLEMDGVRVLDHTDQIPLLVQENDIGLVLFAIEDIDREDRQHIIDLCRQTAARVVLMPDILRTLRERLLPSAEAVANAQTDREESATGQRLADPDVVAFRKWLTRLDRLIQDGSWDLAQAEVKQMHRDLLVIATTQRDQHGKMEKGAHD